MQEEVGQFATDIETPFQIYEIPKKQEQIIGCGVLTIWISALHIFARLLPKSEGIHTAVASLLGGEGLAGVLACDCSNLTASIAIIIEDTSSLKDAIAWERLRV